MKSDNQAWKEAFEEWLIKYSGLNIVNIEPTTSFYEIAYNANKAGWDAAKKEDEKALCFVAHIDNHLIEMELSGKVMCKICKKDIDQIHLEEIQHKDCGGCKCQKK